MYGLLIGLLLGAIDIWAGFMVNPATFPLGTGIGEFIRWFMFLKGITTIIPILPIWFGPIAFLGGIADTLVGVYIYAFLPGLGIFGAINGTLHLIKGLWTLMAMISTSG